MIFNILNKVKSILNENIKLELNISEDIVKIQSIDSGLTERQISLSIINIERDTSGGIAFNTKNISDRHRTKGNPIWHINLYILIAAIFPKNQYAESIKVIYEILKTVQSNYVISLDQKGLQYTMEPVNISLQELSNLWSVSGGSYYPSIVCKIKSIPIDGENVIRVDTDINEKMVNI